jgi:hypothetical protein
MADEQYLQFQAKMKRPLPGQSLTNDPENPAPFERPPEYTSVHEASEYLFLNMIEKESYIPLMQALASGVPVMELTQLVLFTGFQEGKWNPDLMVLLAEPVAYMLIALAEKSDIDVVFYRGEEEDEAEEEELFGLSMEAETLARLKSASKSGEIPIGTFSPALVEKIEEVPEVPQESLLAAPKAPVEEEEEETPAQPSLMAPQ